MPTDHSKQPSSGGDQPINPSLLHDVSAALPRAGTPPPGSSAMPPPGAAGSQRLYSLDALRGFDMFWIMGAEEIFHTLAKATGSPFWGAISNQFTHPAWNGFHFYDLIFPLFLFMAGVATPFSVGRELDKGVARGKLLRRVIRRGLILVILGIIYNNGLELHPFHETRFASVLGRIGLAYMFANIIYLYAARERKNLTMIVWFCALLIGYWLLLLFNSAPGFPHGDLTMQGNFASYIDQKIVPGKLYLGVHDPEGVVSLIPAIGTGLLGILAGNFLKNSPLPQATRALRLVLGGVAFLVLAQVWNLVFPINKNLWTSSFVCETGGLSLLLLGLFYYVIDVLGYKKWAFFFKVIGMNSILIYMSGHFIDWEYMTSGTFEWLNQLVGIPFNALVMAICYVGLKWLFLYFMYLKKVFLRV
jgi:predicted acyltransferase